MIVPRRSFLQGLGLVALPVLSGVKSKGEINNPILEGVVCHACGYGNPFDANYCNQCGERLDPQAGPRAERIREIYCQGVALGETCDIGIKLRDDPRSYMVHRGMLVNIDKQYQLHGYDSYALSTMDLILEFRCWEMPPRIFS